MPWQRTPNGGPGYTCTQPGCSYVTSGDPADIGRHRLEHLARLLEGGPHALAPLAPHAVLAQAEEILRADLERARKLWYPTKR